MPTESSRTWTVCVHQGKFRAVDLNIRVNRLFIKLSDKNIF